MKRFAQLLVPVVLVGAFGVAGCGSSNKSSSSSTSSTATTSTAPSTAAGGGSSLSVTADPGGALKFDKTTLTAKAGKVTIKDVNPSSSGIAHGIAVEGKGVDKDGTGGTSGVSAGQTATVSVTLKPGTYTFYCPVDGHKAAGMKGTLTVK
jgi:uncharacterized cupredoxin-like copper-binding protein